MTRCGGPFRSEKVYTDHNRTFLVTFKGPEVMSLFVSHDDWVQNGDLTTRDTRYPMRSSLIAFCRVLH